MIGFAAFSWRMDIPIKLTDRQERFAQIVATGKATPSGAWQDVYGTSERSGAAHASRVLSVTNGNVNRRIAQIRAQNAAAERVTPAFLTRELFEIAAEARALKRPGEATGALMGIAKLHGLLIDRQQVDMLVRRPTSDPDSPDEMSEDEWLRRHRPAVLGLLPEPGPEPLSQGSGLSGLQGSEANDKGLEPSEAQSEKLNDIKDLGLPAPGMSPDLGPTTLVPKSGTITPAKPPRPMGPKKPKPMGPKKPKPMGPKKPKPMGPKTKKPMRPKPKQSLQRGSNYASLRKAHGH